VTIPPDMAAWLGTAASTFDATLTGLAFETIPFLLIGTFLSALIREFVPDRTLRKIFPRHPMLSIVVALISGTFVPICECGTVPLARQLRQRGLPLSTSVAFLLAAPLVNPLTIVSTWVAFRGVSDRFVFVRIGFGLAAAFFIAYLVDIESKRNPGLALVAAAPRFSRIENEKRPRILIAAARHVGAPSGFVERLVDALDHTAVDFLDTGRYLIGGIVFASVARAFVPPDAIQGALSSTVSAIGIGLLLAFVLSLCSSADAFVARSLFVPASYPAAVAFLLLGPMLDLKNTALLSRFVKPKYLLPFAAIIGLAAAASAVLSMPILEPR